ncbi:MULTISPECIES: acetate--CoA ligase family protein [unclassified Pseudofrankia]|uniref:acetate--CoA ligase family protein n=1 Tax=unclassified Pseudofrankia TaxID=2994372 RepID=UPI0008DA5E6D|nr:MULTISPECIES: acetate--CoA ligase family protein [unclassified Pseudofrankia]MDT3444205.1 acetate--CoA ligase family protein [Pseudofrankia sp. BMG5.37]OHV65231.1 CoA-binding protein [Pseudofrankia sp. BMG5.36]
MPEPRHPGPRNPGLRHVDWSRLFSPRVVAVVGASDTEGSPQRAQWTQVNQRLGALGAEVIPVHPKKPDILGVKAYPSVTALPADPDIVIVLVRDPLPVVEEAVNRNAGFVVVFSAGFGELGTAEGDAAEARLRELASGATRVLGPNTNLNIFEPWPDGLPSRRKLAIITQSGYQGRPITQAQALGVGIEIWATIGNEADLEWADFAGYLAAHRPNVGAIATYVEGFQNGEAFMRAADACANAGIPIVAIKIGRSEEGRVMAAAHTGHLTGPDAVHDAVFDQYGVIRVDDLDEVIEISNMFCQTGLVDGPGGIAVYAMSGGTASHVADLFGAAGVKIPKFGQKTVDALEKYIPWYLRRDNPVDSGGVITARPENREVLQLMLDDPNTDVLFAPITGVFPGMSDALSRDLIALHQKFLAGEGKPVVAAWISPIRDDSYRSLCEAGVPVFHSFNAAVRGLSELGRYSRFVRAYRSPFGDDATAGIPAPAERAVAAVAGRELLAGAGATLNEVDSKKLLAGYGIPVAGERVVTSADDAVAAAAELGPPVVMKIVSADIAHKSDLGLVAVGVADEDAVRATYDRLLATAASAAPEAAIDGVLVAQMVTDAVAEVILGLSHQHPFGPTITFGLGGVFTEVFADVAFAVPPFDAARARRVIESTKGVKILRGTRGRPAGDIDALVDVILRLQSLALDLGDAISELDINPILVRPAGQGVVAVDALVVPTRQP